MIFYYLVAHELAVLEAGERLGALAVPVWAGREVCKLESGAKLAWEGESGIAELVLGAGIFAGLRERVGRDGVALSGRGARAVMNGTPLVQDAQGLTWGVCQATGVQFCSSPTALPKRLDGAPLGTRTPVSVTGSTERDPAGPQWGRWV